MFCVSVFTFFSLEICFHQCCLLHSIVDHFLILFVINSSLTTFHHFVCVGSRPPIFLFSHPNCGMLLRGSFCLSCAEVSVVSDVYHASSFSLCRVAVIFVLHAAAAINWRPKPMDRGCRFVLFFSVCLGVCVFYVFRLCGFLYPWLLRGCL